MGPIGQDGSKGYKPVIYRGLLTARVYNRLMQIDKQFLVESRHNMTDVTDRQRSHSEQPWIETLLDISIDAIIMIDDQQRIVRFNRGAEQIFGYSAREAIGQPLDILIPHSLVNAHQKHIETFASSGDQSRLMDRRQEITGRRKDGSEFPAEASIARVTTQGKSTFLAILRDISERKRAEGALRRRKNTSGGFSIIRTTRSW
ncbi:MAG: PAS domain S-box protein [Chloroflexota bacterium]